MYRDGHRQIHKLNSYINIIIIKNILAKYFIKSVEVGYTYCMFRKEGKHLGVYYRSAGIK